MNINLIDGKITITSESYAYSYESLPTNLKFELIKKIKRVYPNYINDYRKLLVLHGSKVAELGVMKNYIHNYGN